MGEEPLACSFGLASISGRVSDGHPAPLALAISFPKTNLGHHLRLLRLVLLGAVIAGLVLLGDRVHVDPLAVEENPRRLNVNDVP